MKCCFACSEVKPLDAFYKLAKNRDGRNGVCALCMSVRNAIRYQTKPGFRARVTARTVAQVDALRQYVGDYLSEHPCVDCGESDIVVLEFDHVRGEKVNAIANMLQGAVALATLKAEIAKCEVRCANDHRRVTAERAGTWRTCHVVGRSPS